MPDDEAAPAPAPSPAPERKSVTFSLTMPDDLFVASLCRVVDDPRMSTENFPPPTDGYTRASWRARVGMGPVAPALGVAAAEAASGDMTPEKVAARMVEELFSGGLNACRWREGSEDVEDTVLDGRAVTALAVAHFCVNHSSSMATLRQNIHSFRLDDEEHRALWDALDPKNQRWPSDGPLPPLETTLWNVYKKPPGPVGAEALGELAWAVYEALRTRAAGDLVSDMLSSAFSMAEWSKTMRDEMPAAPVEERAMLEALASATPLPQIAVVAPLVDVQPVIKEEAPPTFGAAAPSWVPSPAAAPAAQSRFVGSGDDFERQLREACFQTEMRRRAMI